MIKGLGVDTVEIPAFQRALNRWGQRFLKRMFTPQEIRGASGRKDKIPYFAARFAAKEAVLKSLGTGLVSGMRWHDIETKKRGDGGVEIVVHGGVKREARVRRIRRFYLSLAHCRGFALAFVVAI
jgi:holo-[acyl-carrier protein] synthase